MALPLRQLTLLCAGCQGGEPALRGTLAIHNPPAPGAVPLTLIGIRTGLWAALAGAGPLTPDEVAARSGTAERYVAEWLKAQAAGGYLAYHPDSGRFSLPPEGAAVLADERGTMLVGGFAQMLLAMARDWALVEEGFRSGRGVGWHEHSPEHWDGADQTTAAFIGADLPGAA